MNFENVNIKKGEYNDPGVNMIDRILIWVSSNFSSRSSFGKNLKVKRAWAGAIWGWMIEWEVWTR